MARTRKNMGVTRDQVDEFELVASQLERFHAELKGTRGGKSHDALSDFKLTLLNNLLTRANELLGEQYVAIPGFTQFDLELLPSTSDALLVVSQYLGALEKLRADNVATDYGAWYWVIDGSTSEVRTGPPTKLVKKR